MTLSTTLVSHYESVEDSNTNWAVPLEKKASERLLFVVETNNILFTDDLRDLETARLSAVKSILKS